MVKLYTWGPTTPETVLEHTVAPDVGHSALEVTADDGTTRVYASFWPERDSLIGRVMGLWKKRPARNPTSYTQEIGPEGAYMQRPADHEDEIASLDERLIVSLWKKLQASEYDFLRWNCASVCKLLILSSLPPHFYPMLRELTGEIPAGLSRLQEVEDLQTVMRELSSSPFIDSHPEELRRIAQAYLAAASSPGPTPL